MPAVSLLSTVVTRPLENYSMGEARLIASENACSFLHLINPELDNHYLRGTKQELIFKKISENLESFIENNYLEQQAEPALYVYQVKHDDLVQTGIWTLTHIDDYLENRIKKHEATVERRERLLADYLQQTGLDANPVLMTYPADAVVDGVIAQYLQQQPNLDFTYTDGTTHKVWTISKQQDLDTIVKAFAEMPAVYIADGHHRAASMAKMGMQKRLLNGDKHKGTELYNYFSTVYMNTQEVKVLEFNRLVRDLDGLTEDEFFMGLKKSFSLTLTAGPLGSYDFHDIGMYFKGQWYVLHPNPELYDEHDPVDALDVSILQNFVLGPLLKIKDPRTDARITFEGGRTPLADLQTKVDNGLYEVAFVLCPTSVQQVIAVADAGGVMPPKSTWVEPKFLVGLLTSYFN